MAAATVSSVGSIGMPSRRAPLALTIAVCTAIVPAETGICWLLLDHHLVDVVMVYLLGVVIVAMRFGYSASLLTATLSVAAFDFFFTAPYFSFAVEDKRYVLTFLIMLFVAFVISNLTTRIRRHALEATHREVRTAKLYAMSRELSMAPSAAQILKVAGRHVRDAFASEVSILLPDNEGKLHPVHTEPPQLDIGEGVRSRAQSMFVANVPGAPLTDFVSNEATLLVLLRASTGTLGLLATRSGVFSHPLDAENQQLLGAFASQIASALERANLADEAQNAQVETQRERLRNALLSSVSHDLRTPLAVVKGAATALLDGGPELTASRRRQYLKTISDEASRLNRLVRNLLDMTSLEAGALRPRKEWHPLEEVIGIALNRLEDQLEGRAVDVNIPPEASLVLCDSTLLEHVIVNLAENALKYTPEASPVEINARVVEGAVEVEVADRGPGVPVGVEGQIFEKFQRPTLDATGTGLGLAICRGIISVHGGRIWYEKRPGKGASFRFTLPREETEPKMNVLPELSSEA